MKIWRIAFLILLACSPAAAQSKGHVVEEIIVRVNNEIITRADLERAQAALQEEVRQDCRNCSPQQLQAMVSEKQKNILRDLIDQSLLVQRAKDMGINVEPEVVKRLDQVRQQNNIASMEDLEKKTKNLLERVKKGEDFIELARRYSDGATAQRGGELGVFERSQLSKEIEDMVFKMKKGQVTDVIRTKTGFLSLKVEQRFEAGLQPIEKVEGEISNRLYMEKMEPDLRAYLQTLRQDSYVLVKPGYSDSAAVPGTPIQEVAPTPDEEKEKKGRRKFLLFGKRKKAGQ